MADQSVAVRLRLNTAEYQQGLQRAAVQTRGFGKDVSQVAGTMRRDFTDAASSIGSLVSVAATARFGQQMISDAAALEQAVGGTAAVFGEASSKIDEFADSAVETVGLSKQASRDLTTGLGGALTQVGLSADEAAAKSIDLTKTGADLAATFGGDTADAVGAVGAAFRGEFDSLERFGIFLKQDQVNAQAVAMELADSKSEVDRYGAAMATLALIEQQAAQYRGQFAKESETASVKEQQMRAEMANTSAELGGVLLPIYSDAVDMITKLAGAFGALPDPLQKTALAVAFLVGFQGPIRGTVAAMKTLKTAIASSTAVQFASSRASVAMGGSMSAIKMGAVAAAAGLAILVAAVIDSEQKAKRLREEMKRVAEEINASGDPVGTLATEITSLAATTPALLEAMNAAEVSAEDVAAAALAGGEAWEQMAAKLDTGADLGLGVGIDEVIGRIGQRAPEVEQLAEDLAKIAPETDTAADSAAGLADGLDDATDAGDRLSNVFDTFDAADSLLDALTAIGEVRTEAEESNRALSEAYQEATNRVADAQADYAESVEDAQRRVTDAHEQARRDVEDAMQAVTDAVDARADAEEDAAERVEDAQKKLRRAEEDAADEIGDARQELRDAVANNEDIGKIAQLRERLEDLEKRHSRRLEDAADDVADANRDKADKIEDADRRVEEAHEAYADTVQQADERVADAERARADAITAAQEQVNAAIAAQREASAEMAAQWITEGQIVADTERAKRDAMEATASFLESRYGDAWYEAADAQLYFAKMAEKIGVKNPGLMAEIDRAAGNGPTPTDFFRGTEANPGGFRAVDRGGGGSSSTQNVTVNVVSSGDAALDGERAARRVAMALPGVG